MKRVRIGREVNCDAQHKQLVDLMFKMDTVHITLQYSYHTARTSARAIMYFTSEEYHAQHVSCVVMPFGSNIKRDVAHILEVGLRSDAPILSHGRHNRR